MPAAAKHQVRDHRQDHSLRRSNVNIYPAAKPVHKTLPPPTTFAPQPAIKSYNSGINKSSPAGEKESVPGRFIRNPSIRRKPTMDVVNVRVPDPVPALENSVRRPWTDRGRKTPTPENETYLELVLDVHGSTPWYLKPQYTEQLESDKDGNVRFGTVAALVERLVGRFYANKISPVGLINVNSRFAGRQSISEHFPHDLPHVHDR
jgi:hypothetical protein